MIENLPGSIQEFPQAASLVAALSFVAGAIHVAAPDHWLPASVLTWQRGWSLGRSAMFAALIYVFHLALGLALYFTFESVVVSLAANLLFLFAILLVMGAMGARMLRFTRIREVLRAGPESVWGIFAVLSLLGPCETIIPILVKSRQLGIGYLTPFVAFLAGTTVAGLTLVVGGRMLWNRPLWLPKGLEWAFRRSAILPVVAGLILGLGAILRLSA